MTRGKLLYFNLGARPATLLAEAIDAASIQLFKKLRIVLEQTKPYTGGSKVLLKRSPFLANALEEFGWVGSKTGDKLHDELDTARDRYLDSLEQSKK